MQPVFPSPVSPPPFHSIPGRQSDYRKECPAVVLFSPSPAPYRRRLGNRLFFAPVQKLFRVRNTAWSKTGARRGRGTMAAGAVHAVEHFLGKKHFQFYRTRKLGRGEVRRGNPLTGFSQRDKHPRMGLPGPVLHGVYPGLPRCASLATGFLQTARLDQFISGLTAKGGSFPECPAGMGRLRSWRATPNCHQDPWVTPVGGTPIAFRLSASSHRHIVTGSRTRRQQSSLGQMSTSLLHLVIHAE
jgi:hypothetical protein